VFTAEQEIAIEKLRQILCAMRDFEPYTAFRRLDRECLGVLDGNSLCQFMRENGYRELDPNDFTQLITYFDLDGDNKLNYHDFLQMFLPCEDTYLRAAATQRPNNEIHRRDFLPMRIERAISQIVYKELTL
jgi:hypothetical protein